MAKRSVSAKEKAEEALGEAWWELAEYVAYELNKEGLEGAVLSHLAPFPKSAFDIAWSALGCEDFYIQCIGAVIPAYVPGMYDETLAWMWEELKERRGADNDEMVAAECNSVAERVLISAVHWMRNADHRDRGIEVLRDMVEQTIAGTFWNDAHLAAAALVQAKVPGAAKLAKGLAGSALGREHFEKYLGELVQGDTGPFESVDIICDTSRCREFKLPAARRKQCEALARACEAWESFAVLERE